jgi:UDP-N-acetylglucosamine 2-epimerase (non-hydrolysing)
MWRPGYAVSTAACQRRSINRVVVDQIADLLFTPSPDANDNLAREGVDPRRVHYVGNVMVDTLLVSVGGENAAYFA